MRPRAAHWAALLLVIGLVLAVDQAAKTLIESRLAPGEMALPIPAISDYFRIVRSHNTGAAFGLLPGAGGLFSVIAVGVSVAMLVAHARMPAGAWGKRLAMGLVAAGALGNVIDRVRVGYVIDFINYRIPGVISNVSNLADHAIVIGIIALLIMTWRRADEADAASEPTPE